MVDTNTSASAEASDTYSNGTAQGKRNAARATQQASTSRAMAKRALPTLVTSGQQKRETLKLTASIAANAKLVADSNFPLHTAFVVSPESSELFQKLDKHTIASLFSSQKYSSNGISGYLVNFS